MADGNDSFSSVHAAWNAHGAHEFVPGAGFKSTGLGMHPRYREHYDPRGYQYHMSSMYPPVAAAYPTQNYWPHLLPVPNPWQTFPDMGTGMTMASKSVGAEIAPPTKFLVAMWNLSPAYSKEVIKQELEELDITHVKVRMCPEVAGSCLLWCVEQWAANAVATMLDMTDDIMQVAEGESIRAVRFTNDLRQLLSEDMPYDLRKALIQEAGCDA